MGGGEHHDVGRVVRGRDYITKRRFLLARKKKKVFIPFKLTTIDFHVNASYSISVRSGGAVEKSVAPCTVSLPDPAAAEKESKELFKIAFAAMSRNVDWARKRTLHRTADSVDILRDINIYHYS